MGETTERVDVEGLIRELEGAVRGHHDYRRLPEHVRSARHFEDVAERLGEARAALQSQHTADRARIEALEAELVRCTDLLYPGARGALTDHGNHHGGTT